METNVKTAESWCCTDCLVLLANGETPEHLDETETAEYLARVTDDHVTLGRGFDDCGHDIDGWRNGDESHAVECEYVEFSWSQCDVCHSTLGGARHAVTFWLY